MNARYQVRKKLSGCWRWWPFSESFFLKWFVNQLSFSACIRHFVYRQQFGLLVKGYAMFALETHCDLHRCLQRSNIRHPQQRHTGRLHFRLHLPIVQTTKSMDFSGSVQAASLSSSDGSGSPPPPTNNNKPTGFWDEDNDSSFTAHSRLYLWVSA